MAVKYFLNIRYMNSAPVTLDGNTLSPAKLSAVANGASININPDALKHMARARAVIDQAIAKRTPVYGVTTGLGPRVTQALAPDSIDSFSLNTIRGRAHGVGSPLHPNWVRAGVAVRINTLLIGAAGARPALAEHLCAVLNAELTPVIPETGTIGVADLCWGGALGLAMIGEGEMHLPDGSIANAKQAMAAVGIVPFQPQPREGLALVSHSTLTAGMAALGWMEIQQSYEASQTSAALSMEGFRANLSPLEERVLALRPQPGQSEAANGLRSRLQGSSLFNPGEARRLQDPLSIRNIVQVHGTVQAMMDVSLNALTAEINGASDNPAVLVESSDIISHGGYLPPLISVTLNAYCQACVHMAALQVARISKLLSKRFSGLSDGLSFAGAEGAGLGPVMKTAESLYAEISHLSSTPPIYPGISADGLEDVVTHAAIPTKNLFPIAKRLRLLCAIEAIVAAQAIDLRELSSPIAQALLPIYATIRSVSAPFGVDRALGTEIEKLAIQIEQGAFSL